MYLEHVSRVRKYVHSRSTTDNANENSLCDKLEKREVTHADRGLTAKARSRDLKPR
jgi:hypothetical protein